MWQLSDARPVRWTSVSGDLCPLRPATDWAAGTPAGPGMTTGSAGHRGMRWWAAGVIAVAVLTAVVAGCGSGALSATSTVMSAPATAGPPDSAVVCPRRGPRPAGRVRAARARPYLAAGLPGTPPRHARPDIVVGRGGAGGGGVRITRVRHRRDGAGTAGHGERRAGRIDTLTMTGPDGVGHGRGGLTGSRDVDVGSAPGVRRVVHGDRNGDGDRQGGNPVDGPRAGRRGRQPGSVRRTPRTSPTSSAHGGNGHRRSR